MEAVLHAVTTRCPNLGSHLAVSRRPMASARYVSTTKSGIRLFTRPRMVGHLNYRLGALLADVLLVVPSVRGHKTHTAYNSHLHQ